MYSSRLEAGDQARRKRYVMLSAYQNVCCTMGMA